MGGASHVPGKPITKVYGSTLLALPGGGWDQISRKKRYVTFEWPPRENSQTMETGPGQILERHNLAEDSTIQANLEEAC